MRTVLLRPSGVIDQQDIPDNDEAGDPPRFVLFENRLYERSAISDQHDAQGRIHAYAQRQYVHPIR